MRFLRWEPSHGLRKFVGEIAIVSLGVLLALGLEQWITSFNAHQDAAKARLAVRYEIGINLGSLSKRFQTGECINKRLLEIKEFIEAASNTNVEKSPLWFGRPQVWIMDSARWQAASNTGRANLFSLEEQTNFSDIYGSFNSVHESQQAEQMFWAQLRSLEGQHQISETTASSMRLILSQAVHTNWRIGISYAQARERALEMGIPIVVDPVYRGSKSVCIPITTPRETAIKLTGSRYGEP